ncbi:hypothetical protein K1T71_008511, partial [Dendrolimus kikuchii]
MTCYGLLRGKATDCSMYHIERTGLATALVLRPFALTDIRTHVLTEHTLTRLPHFQNNYKLSCQLTYPLTVLVLSSTKLMNARRWATLVSCVRSPLCPRKPYKGARVHSGHSISLHPKHTTNNMKATLYVILLVAAVYGAEEKKNEKRGLLGLGYGLSSSYYGHGLGLYNSAIAAPV